jgi:anti-sigma regulatory factor (Ser/Thr protein kinase)
VTVTRFKLAGGRRAPRQAREAIDIEFRSMIDEEEQDTLNLLVTELVTNAVVHAGDERPTVHLAVAPEQIRAEIYDHGPGFDPDHLPPKAGSSLGLGLVLVDKSASRWGVTIAAETCVWFELDR